MHSCRYFYWIEDGRIPCVYTEGGFDTSMEFLKKLPKAKCIVRFEFGDLSKKDIPG